MIVLMGVAGSGKSMQGRLFADEKGLAWISTGEILRVLVTGKRRLEMLQGKLLNDDEIINIIDKVFELVDLSGEVVIDGFPRTVAQAKWLLEQVDSGRFNLTGIFNLVAPEEVVRRRLHSRGRVDDTDNAIKTRFDEYRAVTLPILDLFRGHNLPVHDINANQSPEKVHSDILRSSKALKVYADKS